MPQNTTVPNPGVDLGYQNPGTTSAVLDAEVVGTDPVTGAQLTREFVVPVESISGQSSLEILIPIMMRILNELRAIRTILEAEAVPEVVDAVEDILASDSSDDPESESEES